MPNLTTLTLDQLHAATKAQIVTAITAKLNTMTKRQIILFLLDRTEQNAKQSDAPVSVYRKDGQIQSQTQVERDLETGTRTGGRVTAWAYYPTGEVDTITISERDAADKETKKRVIKHFVDGRQPVVTE